MKKKSFTNTISDIVETILKKCGHIFAPRKCFRIVHYQRISTGPIGLNGINRAFSLKLAGGQKFKLAVLDSWKQHDELLRQCKARSEFILLLVDTGYETSESLIETLWVLLRNAVKWLKRQIRKHRHVRPGRSTDNYIQRRYAPCVAH